jgi:hypothetical protein
MGRACGIHRSHEKYIQNFGLKTQIKKDHLEDTGTDRRIILKLILEK